LFVLGLESCRADLKFGSEGGGSEGAPTLDIDLGAGREGSRTDDELIKREEEAIKLDGLSVSQLKELREKSDKFQFQVKSINDNISRSWFILK
jgi:hypothetical protein